MLDVTTSFDSLLTSWSNGEEERPLPNCEVLAMFELLKKTYLAGLGLATLTKDRIEEIVDELVKRGEVAEKDRKQVMDELLARARDEQQKLSTTIKESVKKVVGEMRVPGQEQWEDLVKRVEDLEKRGQETPEAGPENASSSENG
jgi:polyhydroxyalkanoate synthesis regulator phasin